LADPAVQRNPADGAKPSDLPSQPPSKIYLVADRGALKALRLAFPRSFLAGCRPADRGLLLAGNGEPGSKTHRRETAEK